MKMGAIYEYFQKKPNPNNSLFPYAENYKACLIRAKELRRRQFLECLGAKLEGRGTKVSVFVEEMELFNQLESERFSLFERSEGILKMFDQLDAIIARLGDIQIRSKTPYGLLSGIGERKNRIAGIQDLLRREAEEALGIPYGLAVAGTPSCKSPGSPQGAREAD